MENNKKNKLEILFEIILDNSKWEIVLFLFFLASAIFCFLK